MNTCFRVLWNTSRQAWIVAPERAGTAGGRCLGSLAAAMLLSAGSLLTPLLADTTLPTGAQVSAGSASFSQSANTLTVHQGSQQLITNWQSFSIGEGATVNFQQPGSSAVALNRVLGQDPSQILGALNANGQVFLVNPSGVVFGQGAQVNTGALVASSLGISDAAFLAGDYRFSGTSGGDILNQGSLNGSTVALIAPLVRNQGSIHGDTALAGGTDVTLDFNGDGLLSLTVNAATLATLVDNQGLIHADGGHVILTARGASEALTGVVNHSGTIQAQTLAERDGRIMLLGDMDHGQTHVSGTLDASAPNGGDGGFIETSAARVQVTDSARITTQADGGRTGLWLIDPQDYTIASTGGDITGAALSQSLTTTSVEIESVQGGTEGNGDIFVNDAIAWSANTLTLTAERNIAINATLDVTGTAELVLRYAQSDATGDYTVGDVMDPANTGRVNLAASSFFRTQRGADAVIDYTIITELGDPGSTTATDLQGMNGDLAGNYVLGADIDAAATSGWNGGQGFAPIGTTFTGRFDGLGHTISGLTINRAGFVGMFARTAVGASIRNVGLDGGSFTGGNYTGPLVGENAAQVRNVYATSDVQGTTQVGGLLGAALDGSSVSRSYAAGEVTGGASVGGLIGEAEAGSTVNQSYASGNAIGTGSRVGGLIGEIQSGSSVLDSYAIGNVEGVSRVGGLVGFINGVSADTVDITNTYAAGFVFGNDNVGGLVGEASNGDVANVVHSFFLDSEPDNGFGTQVTTAELQDPFTFTDVGWDFATIWGADPANIINTGFPIHRTLLGSENYPKYYIRASVADLTRTYGDSNPDLTGQWTIANCNGCISDIDWGSAITADTNVGTYAYSDADVLALTLAEGTTADDFVIRYGTEALTITPRELSVDYAVSDRTYDGTTIATLSSPAMLVGVLANDAGSVVLSSDTDASFEDRNVGENKTVTLGGLGIDGAAASNYSLADTATTTASITPAILVIGTEAVSKDFDGTVAADGSAIVTEGTLFGDDSLSGGTFAFTDPDPGTNKTVLVSGVTVNDGNQGNNYAVTFGPNTDSTILPITSMTSNVPGDPRLQEPADEPWRAGSEQPMDYDGLLTMAPHPNEDGLVTMAQEVGSDITPPPLPLTLYEALVQEFAGDLPGWGAEIDRLTLSVNFGAPDTLFEVGESSIRPQYREILEDFFPRYLAVLTAYRHEVEGIAIEGHTSSEWLASSSEAETYERNMILSQARASLVRSYVLGLPRLSSEHDWVRPYVTDTGYSSQYPVLDDQGEEDAVRSRRVSFRVIPR